MACTGGVLSLPVLLTAFLLTGPVYTSAANSTHVNQTTASKGTDPSTANSRNATGITTTTTGNSSEVPGSASTIHPSNTTTPSGEYHHQGETNATLFPTEYSTFLVHDTTSHSTSNHSASSPLLTRFSSMDAAPLSKPLTTGHIVAIVLGVLAGVVVLVILFLCLRRTSGYRKATSAPVTYRKGSNMRTDRAPLTTKGKDPSPLPGCVEDHFTLYEDEFDRRLQKQTNGEAKKALRRDHGDRESLDGDGTSARDGGDDDYFYDEIFGQSAFTDEKTSASIKELSSPKPDDEWPDLEFDDFELDDPFK